MSIESNEENQVKDKEATVELGSAYGEVVAGVLGVAEEEQASPFDLPAKIVPEDELELGVVDDLNIIRQTIFNFDLVFGVVVSKVMVDQNRGYIIIETKSGFSNLAHGRMTATSQKIKVQEEGEEKVRAVWRVTGQENSTVVGADRTTEMQRLTRANVKLRDLVITELANNGLCFPAIVKKPKPKPKKRNGRRNGR